METEGKMGINGHPWLYGGIWGQPELCEPLFQKTKAKECVFLYSSAGQMSASVSLGQVGVSKILQESLVSLAFSSSWWQWHSWALIMTTWLPMPLCLLLFCALSSLSTPNSFVAVSFWFWRLDLTCVALADLEVIMQTRLALNSVLHLPLPPPPPSRATDVI